MRVNRAAVAAKDARTPGYRAGVEAMATGGTDTHYEVPQAAYLELVRQHRPVVVVQRRKRFALGNAVERMLTAVGITQERVQAWTRTKDCGCKARARWLNQWGYRQQEQLERVLRKAARWCGFG